MKTIQEQIEVMQHFANGGEVEKHYGVDGWEVVFNPAWSWSTQDYRIKQPVDPYAELKAAAADPTKQIRNQIRNGGSWYDAGAIRWEWCLPVDCYEIRDKPKQLKKVKMLAWFDGFGLFWRTEKYESKTAKRVPMQDKVIEVEE